MSVATENASGTAVDMNKDGATTNVVAVKPSLFVLHHFFGSNNLLLTLLETLGSKFSSNFC